jgi:hypothetical protein
VLRAVNAVATLRRPHAYLVLSSVQGPELSLDLLGLLEHRGIPLFAKPCDPSALVTAVAAAARRLAGSAYPDRAPELLSCADVWRT